MQEAFWMRVVAFWHTKGRHNLPWQQHHKAHPDPYAVWVSEVMLQQTQVKTVLEYYGRFMAAFPTVHALAQAPWEAVAMQWAGLGYYARAQNLHQGARQMMHYLNNQGVYPDTLEGWMAIRGIGRTTAGAILAMGMRKRGVILDGNVMRVLARHAGITDDIARTKTQHMLWEIACSRTPSAAQAGVYAQGMMDLGAIVCTKKAPACTVCAVSDDCIAYKTGLVAELPKKRATPKKTVRCLYALNITQGCWRLYEIPKDTGLWRGYWMLPLVEDLEDAPVDLSGYSLKHHASITHILTHQKLHLVRVDVALAHKTDAPKGYAWRKVDAHLPRPVVLDKILG